jgi:hypothetical protein
MIGKGKSIAHTSNAIDYAMNKPHAIEVSRNLLVGETGKQMAQEFRVFQNLNARCQRNSFSFVLSPTIPVGNKLTNEAFANLADDFLSRMKLNENQFISFLHSDDKHKHLHIFVNRINENGKAYKDNYISKKAQRIAESMAKARGFTTAKEIQQEREERLSRQIKAAHEKVLPQIPKDIFAYADLMKNYGIESILKQASNEKVVGIRFKISKESIKASVVDRSFSASRLQKLIQENYAYHKRDTNRYQRNKIQARKNKFRI